MITTPSAQTYAVCTMSTPGGALSEWAWFPACHTAINYTKEQSKEYIDEVFVVIGPGHGDTTLTWFIYQGELVDPVKLIQQNCAQPVDSKG